METQDKEQESLAGAHGTIRRARTLVSEMIGHVADRLPGALGQAESGARTTVTRMQTMPDSTLRLLAAASIGLGAGLRVAGAPRLVTLAGFTPASLFGFAIISRPRRSHQAPHPAQP